MAAEVKILGFEWILNGGKIKEKDFCDHLVTLSGHELDKKILVMTKQNNLYIGVLMKITDMSSFCQIKIEGGNFTLSNEKLEKGAKMADFNFFILNPKTMKGLYQYYHKSTSLNRFSFFIKKRFNEYKKKAVENAILEAKKKSNDGKLSKKSEKEIRSDYASFFRYAPILKPDSFEEYVQKMKDISYFEFEIVTANILDTRRVAFSKYAKRTSHKVFFDQTGGVLSNIKNSINQLCKAGEFKRAKIKGIDPDNQEAIYNLSSDVEQFATYDYDDIAAHIKLKSDDLTGSLERSKMIKELFNQYSKSKIQAILDTPWE